MSTTQGYQAAEQLLRRPARPGELVIGDKVRPQWIDGGGCFWYAVSNGVGRRFVLVDPAAGTREPAFDHAGSPPVSGGVHQIGDLHDGVEARLGRIAAGVLAPQPLGVPGPAEDLVRR
jgi:hypothetical protein